MPSLGILELKFEKVIVMLQTTLEFFVNVKFHPKIKYFKFGQKVVSSLSGLFWAAILKIYCHIRNQCPRICLTAKFGAKIKILKFGKQNA